MSEKQRSAAERIQDLESMVMGLYQTMDNMARDLILVKDAARLLLNRVESIIACAEEGGLSALSSSSVESKMVLRNIDELKSKVDGLLAQGVLSPQEEATETSFLVGREVDADGKVVNPRLQFSLRALSPEMRSKMVGSKTGQKLQLEEGKLQLEVLELYEIKQ